MFSIIAYIGLFGPICIAIVGISFVSAFTRLFSSEDANVAHEDKID